MRRDFAEQSRARLAAVVCDDAAACGVVENRRRLWAAAMRVFAVVLAAVWLSNAPAAVVASYSVALIFTWAGRRKVYCGLVAQARGGLALGFGLAELLFFCPRL